MSQPHASRRGTLQFWPRKRSRHSLARVRSWVSENKTKPLGFIGYKAGMTHLIITDPRPKSLTKGEKIAVPSTIIDCPPLYVVGISFYKKQLLGMKKLTSIFVEKPSKDLEKRIQLPKKAGKKFEEVIGFDDLKLLVHSQPKLAAIGVRKPKLMEIALGGKKEEKIAYAKKVLDKEINVKDVVESGSFVDVKGITKGKGFQGTVKRYGVPIRQHKAEKTKRGIGNLGSWTPKRVQFTVAQSGKMGYHQRTEYNKQVMEVGEDSSRVNHKGGIVKYGEVKNPYLLIKGSVVGSKKRALFINMAIRPDVKKNRDAPEVSYISQKN